MNPRILVVGAGAWGKNHIRTFHQLGALAGVVEPVASLREKILLEYPGLPVWGAMEDGLPFADGVVLATPGPTHGPLAMAALAAGKGVLVEKPMTLDVEEAEGLVVAAQKAGRPLMVGHLLLFQPAITELKNLLDKGLIGRLFRIHQERLNHGRVRATEDVMWSFSCHDLAVLLYLMGEPPCAIQASGASFLQPGIHDDVHLELGFSVGRSAHVHAAWYWPGKQRGLRVFGEKGMIVYDETDQSLTLHRKHLGEALAPVDLGTERIFEGHGEPLKLEAQHFLECLATGCTPLTDGPSGVDVVRVLELAQSQLAQFRITECK